MEKLLEFKKGKIFDEHSKTYRFQCDCLSAEDALDINIDSSGKDDEGKFVTIMMDFIDYTFGERLRRAWHILKGDWGFREFCVRQEDLKPFSDILNPDKKFSELP